MKQASLPGLASPSANAITAALLIEIPKRFPNARVWRRNVGVGVGMDTVKKAIGLLLSGAITAAIALLRSRPIKFGLQGEPDLDGIIPIERDGLLWGIRLGIEVKAGRDTIREQQERFGAMLVRAGAIYVLARSVEQAMQDIATQVKTRTGDLNT